MSPKKEKKKKIIGDGPINEAHCKKEL